MDDLLERVRTYCDREGLMQDGGSLVIGLSGGADSVCLFYLLSDICEKRHISLISVHVHHGIRGEEADRDAAFVRELARENGASCIVCHVDAPGYAKEKGLSLEEAARILRYRELERIRLEQGAYAIALAHHRDDQAETVLMNLSRGTGPVGLAGMLPRSGTKIRPLLSISKMELLGYLKENHIDFVEDSTNSDTNYTRNKIRKEVIPILEGLYPGASERIASTANDVRVWRDYIRQEALMIAGKNDISDGTACLIPVKRYRESPGAIREELLRIAVEAMIPSRKDVSRAHYRMLASLFEKEESGRSIDLPGGIRAVRTAAAVRFYRKEEGEAEPVRSEKLVVPGEVAIETKAGKWLFSAEIIEKKDFNMKKDDFFLEKDYTKYFDYGKIKGDLLLRSPREGDFFELEGTGSRKKLSRFYIDRKLPREQRKEQIVLADDSHILWALPDRISAAYRVTDETELVLKVSRSERKENERDDYQED